ncbi:unnamed protein product [Leptidea sinapis]|uniref:Cyclic nucleotide-binding domain-containing protein n=1 Tax=Leptidea sinapis TaxID=189913 RepID=A0A5E4PNH2_9NEOP|nr:unnamed protein product [Leptidea sinapis]
MYLILNIILPSNIDENNEVLLNTIMKFAHLYMLLGYFNYIADSPTKNIAFYMILKFHILSILVVLGTSSYFVSRCIDFGWDAAGQLVTMTRRNECWIPSFIPLDENPTLDQLHMVYAESFNLAQCGLMRFHLGRFRIDRENFGVGITLVILGILFWFITCYSLTLLVLNFRGNTLFQHRVRQLRRFLEAERVEKHIIVQAVNHFRYWWFRTKGINIHKLMNERVGVVFRQDLAYYFYKATIEATDTLLHGGEALQRQLVSLATQWYFLPGQVIVREMDLSPWVYIVHRGVITIKRDDSNTIILTKGSIFGQLDGNKPRPVRMTAIAENYADLLQITIKDFQDIIDNKTCEYISLNQQAKSDFMAVHKICEEDPFNTIQYILRGLTVTYHQLMIIEWLVIMFDILHCMYLISEFYTIELVVVNGQCRERPVMFRMFKNWQYYIDILSISHVAPVLLKLAIVCLTIHGITCGWIYIACHDQNFPMELPELTSDVNATIDYDEWASPLNRNGGCARVTIIFEVNGKNRLGFLVPKKQFADYIVAFMYVFVVYTHQEIDVVVALTLPEIYYKVLINYIIQPMEIWVLSVAISSVYAKYRELYSYDYNVLNLIVYLEHSGNWLPELARQAPQCLQEDIFSALYMHHLETLPLFRELPLYFRRQLVTRLQRVVIFPGTFDRHFLRLNPPDFNKVIRSSHNCFFDATE